MANYTDEQIKKALELCDNWKSGDCLNCPLADECEKDSEVLIHNSLDLINRKEEEIERLMQKLQQPQSEAIDNAPAVDAVEVVRCKDCRHWCEDIGWCDINSHFVDDNDAPCSPEDSPNWRMFNADDFCSYGERRVSE